MSAEIIIVEDNTQKIIKMSQKAINKALEEMGLVGEDHAKEYCPVDTGNLRNSITHTRDDNSAYIGTNVEYAPYVELGTSRQKAQPYLKPAVQNHKDEYIAIIKQNMENA